LELKLTENPTPPAIIEQAPRKPLRWSEWVLLVIITIIYLTAIRDLVSSWITDSQYSLGFFAPVVSVYFTWKRWPELKRIERSSSAWGIVLMVIAILLRLAGAVLGLSKLSFISIPAIIIGLCLYLLGARMTRLLAFSLAFTIFMLPDPLGLTAWLGQPMQLFASSCSAHLLNLLGIETAQSGIRLTVEGFRFDVALACSGMSSLIALIAVTAVIAYTSRLPNNYRWMLFSFAVPIAIIASVVRITTIALVGCEWGWGFAIDAYHHWSSLLLFAVAIILLFILNRGLEWLSAARAGS